MDTFFGPTGPGFTPYSSQHVIALTVAALLLGLIFIFRQTLRRPLWNLLFRRGLAALLLALHAALQLWYVTTGNWELAESLPLQLCTISLLLSGVLMWTRNYKLYEFIYFAGIGGALQALFTPVLNVGFPHFWYVYFFAGHGSIVAAALFMTVVEGFRPTWRSVLRTMGWLNLLLIVVFPVNALTGANYMFVSRKPDTPSLLDLLGPWPWYLLPLELVALALFALLMLPFVQTKKRIDM
ncbi:TIGR02206 family membrane protein [Paenibacillus tarimensis]